MKVKLTRDQRIMHKAGEIVEVSPETRNFLVTINSAVDVKEAVEVKQPKKRGK